MMNDEELKAHKLAALFASKSPAEKQGRHTQFRPQPKPDLTDSEVIAAVSDLNSEFAPTLAPEALPTLPQRHQTAPTSFLNAHTVIIDHLLMNPAITTKALATATGYTRGWLSRVMQSDAFQAKLAERSKALVDPIVMANIEARLKGMTSMALEVLEEKLETTQSADLALSILAVTTKSLGMGQRQPSVVAVQNSFIVHVPPKVASAGDWAAQYGAGGSGVGLGATVASVREEPLVSTVEPAESVAYREILESEGMADVQEAMRGAAEEMK